MQMDTYHLEQAQSLLLLLLKILRDLLLLRGHQRGRIKESFRHRGLSRHMALVHVRPPWCMPNPMCVGTGGRRQQMYVRCLRSHTTLPRAQHVPGPRQYPPGSGTSGPVVRKKN